MHRKSLEAADKLKDYEQESDDEYCNQSERSTPSPSPPANELVCQTKSVQELKKSNKTRCNTEWVDADHKTSKKKCGAGDTSSRRMKATQQQMAGNMPEQCGLKFMECYSKSQASVESSLSQSTIDGLSPTASDMHPFTSTTNSTNVTTTSPTSNDFHANPYGTTITFTKSYHQKI